MFLSKYGLVLSDEVLSLADQLLEKGNYDSAITEYKRFIFFNPKGDQTGNAFYNMGLAYRAERNWQDAIDALSASILLAENPDIADERRITLATTLIASGNYSLARLELIKIAEFSKSHLLCLKASYFSGIASLYMYDWNTAKKSFNDFYLGYADRQLTNRANEVDSVLSGAGRSYKSVRLARILSAVIPGAGQIYACDWRDGLNAFVLNGLITGFVANAIYRKDYKDALLIFSILSLRYYLGNIYHAGMDVRKYNESLDRKNSAKVLRIVSADEPS